MLRESLLLGCTRQALRMCEDRNVEVAALDAAESSTLHKTSTNMRTANSPAVAVTTQEGVDGSRGKIMIIASVEQTQSTGIMDISVKGELIVCAGRLGISHGVTPSDTNGWEVVIPPPLVKSSNILEETCVRER